RSPEWRVGGRVRGLCVAPLCRFRWADAPPARGLPADHALWACDARDRIARRLLGLDERAGGRVRRLRADVCRSTAWLRRCCGARTPDAAYHRVDGHACGLRDPERVGRLGNRIRASDSRSDALVAG